MALYITKKRTFRLCFEKKKGVNNLRFCKFIKFETKSKRKIKPENAFKECVSSENA